MNVNRKEIKAHAKGTIKSHYGMFVISLLLCAIMGIAYNSSTYVVSMLKSDNTDKAKNAVESIQENTVIDEDGNVVINSSSYDTSYDIAELIQNLFINNSESAKIIQNAANGGTYVEEDSQYGFITVSYKNGVLASLINNVKSGSFILSIANSLSKVIADPSVITILALLAGVLLLLAYDVFVENAVWITTKRLFLEAQNYSSSNPKVYLFLLKRKTYARACVAFFVKQFYLMLWSLTVVGGFIKYFSYAMVPYIIAENPTLNPHQAIRLSRRMMNGHKWEMCKLYLSFLGWEILNLFTLGLLGLFFLNPYIESTFAAYYLKVREHAIDNKIEEYELLNDKYLTTLPTEEDLEPVYGKLIADCKTRSRDEAEKYTGVAGFFANVFGIVLNYNDKARRINQQEEDLNLIERYNLVLEGKLYPRRLHPSSTAGSRTPIFQSLQFLKRYSIVSLIALFFIGCFVGWLWEVGIHLVEDGVFVNRGVMHGPWLPIYGTGACVILIVLYRFRNKAWLEFILAVLLCGIIEYFTSWMLEVTHNGQKWWDYTGYFLNINGRVCAEGLLVFGVAGMVFVYFAAPVLDSLIQKIPLKVIIPILTALIIIFVADNIYSRFYPNTGKGITDYGQETSYSKQPRTQDVNECAGTWSEDARYNVKGGIS